MKPFRAGNYYEDGKVPVGIKVKSKEELMKLFYGDPEAPPDHVNSWEFIQDYIGSDVTPGKVFMFTGPVEIDVETLIATRPTHPPREEVIVNWVYPVDPAWHARDNKEYTTIATCHDCDIRPPEEAGYCGCPCWNLIADFIYEHDLKREQIKAV